MSIITVIGAGSWGTALAQLLDDNKQTVKLYDISPERVEEINQKHTNEFFLPGVKLSETIRAYSDLSEALEDSEMVLMVVPTKVIRSSLKSINQALDHPVIFVNASKGIEPNTYKRVSEIVYEEIDADKLLGFVSLTGPSHAEEVIQRQLTSITAASDKMELAKRVQETFNNEHYFRVYTANDLIGAEIGGSLKNIIALAAGIIAGLGYGDNTRAALITRGLAEMRRLAVAMGAKEETLFGLAGIGDLVVTATSQHSRNFQAGYRIGSGSNLKEALASMTMVVEGVRSCEAAYQYAKDHNIEMPITFAVYDVIFNEVEPRDAIKELMCRDLKEE